MGYYGIGIGTGGGGGGGGNRGHVPPPQFFFAGPCIFQGGQCDTFIQSAPPNQIMFLHQCTVYAQYVLERHNYHSKLRTYMAINIIMWPPQVVQWNMDTCWCRYRHRVIQCTKCTHWWSIGLCPHPHEKNVRFQAF